MDDGNAAAAAAEGSAAQPIPLICSICPKNTKFSDVSHLLTHIASKGHLSSMFKLDIAKNSDDSARERLEVYQTWFDDHNIRDLLQNRSENRIQKGTGARARNSPREETPARNLRGGAQNLASRNTTKRGTMKPEKRRSRNDSKSTAPVDPVKYEPENSFDTLQSFNSSSHAHIRQPWHHAQATQSWANLPSWNGAYFGHGVQHDLGFGIGQSIGDVGIDDERDVETSSRYQPSDAEEEEEDDDDDCSSNLLPSEDTMDTTFDSTVPDADVYAIPGKADDEERERNHFRKYLKGDIAKLDGVGGFDAAPEEQRKKRNQKKDPSVLVHMEASSRAVQTCEQVTDLYFNHVRWRDVYDDPSVDGSADEDEDDKDDKPKPAKKVKKKTPKKSRGKIGRPRGSKKVSLVPVEPHVSETVRGNKRGRGARTTRQFTARPTVHRTNSNSTQSNQSLSEANLPITRVTRSSHLGFDPGHAHELPAGHVRVGNRTVDVFRDNADPLPGSIDSLLSQPGHDGLHGLALRPANVNLSLLSSTAMLKRHTPTRLYSAKENGHGSFNDSSTTSNPYLSNVNAINEDSFNPLCVPHHESSSIRVFPWETDRKASGAAFRPINGHSEFTSMDSYGHENYHRSHRQDGGSYDL